MEKKIFGVDLKKLQTPLPEIILDMIEFIESDCLEKEGLFRISGHSKSMKLMKILIDEGKDFDEVLNVCTTGKEYTICGLLKSFIIELPDSIIPGIRINNYR
jgi:hypothetical protein